MKSIVLETLKCIPNSNDKLCVACDVDFACAHVCYGLKNIPKEVKKIGRHEYKSRKIKNVFKKT